MHEHLQTCFSERLYERLQSLVAVPRREAFMKEGGRNGYKVMMLSKTQTLFHER